jgi:hypothetical protein
MKRSHSTDFDVITGPSMASACPIVETAPAPPQPLSQSRLAESSLAGKPDGGATVPAPHQPAPASPV